MGSAELVLQLLQERVEHDTIFVKDLMQVCAAELYVNNTYGVFRLGKSRPILVRLADIGQ